MIPLLGRVVHAMDPDWEVEFLSGLRARGLYRLAVRHAEGILAQTDISVAARIDLTIELSRTLSQWALASPPHTQGAGPEELWHRGHACLHDALARVPTHPRRVLLELQEALLWLAEGEVAKDEAALTASDAQREVARQKLRQAIAMLDSLAERVKEALRRERMARRRGTNDQSLSIEELTSLSQHIVLQTAEALQSQGETYPAESPDRVNALTRAVDQLEFLVSRVGDSDLRRQAQVRLVACHRLLGHLADAERLLTTAAATKNGPQTELAPERVRLLIAAGRVADAKAIARTLREELANETPELALAHLEAIVTAALATKDPAAQTQAISEATLSLDELAARHGPIWQRRGELWVAKLLAATNTEATTISTARLAAEGLYRAGRLSEAVAAFDRSAALARGQSDPNAAMDLALAAAGVVRQMGDEREAARRYLEIALAAPADPRAAEAHRAAILATADAARAADSAEERTQLLSQYERLLQEYLATWSAGPLADEVRVWLARWWLETNTPEHLGRAIDLLPAVAAESEHFAASRRLLAAAYASRIVHLENAAERAALANEAAHALQPVITGADNRWPSEWTDLQRETALTLARLQLVHAPDGDQYAQGVLTAALAGPPPAPAQWRQRASGLLLGATLSQGHAEQAEEMLTELETAPLDVKAEIVVWLGKLQSRGDDSSGPALGRAVLRLLESMTDWERTADPEIVKRLAHERARALAATGRRAEATQAYAELTAQSPEDAAAFEEYADLLAGSPSDADHQAALRLYQKIEQRTKPGGPRWARARVARITLLARLGETQSAQKLFKLTAAMHPELGESELQEQFAELAKQMELRGGKPPSQ